MVRVYNPEDSDIGSEVIHLLMDTLPPTDIAEQRSCWNKANDEAKEHFKLVLGDRLNSIGEPDCNTCRDVHCKDKSHSEHIEEYTMNILEAMENTGKQCLPSSGGNTNNQRRIAGWAEHVKPYAEESKFWYKVWLSDGKPQNGPIFENMKQSKINLSTLYVDLKE